jgi:hypothetical protein
MSTLEEYISPDGRLRFRVDADPDGDLALGFDGYHWHTHADILASLSGLAQAEAVRRFVDDLLSDRLVIALWGVPGEVRDVWVSEAPARDKAYATEGETIELRYWSGRPWVNT